MNIVESKKTLYTPSKFAKDNFIYLQEIGYTKSLKKHTSSRNSLDSFLFLLVKEGNGEFQYNNKIYKLHKNDCVFIDCQIDYSHTSDNWTIQYIHFNGNKIKNIYDKYLQRQGKNIFNSNNTNNYIQLFDNITIICTSTNYVKDMELHSQLTQLLSLLMSETVYHSNCNKINDIKEYIDNNYLSNPSLDQIANTFFINKFYLTRLFKETYGITINNYINNKKIEKAKYYLRFSNLNMEQIAKELNLLDNNYFSRLFKKIEGITPKEYKSKWRN